MGSSNSRQNRYEQQQQRRRPTAPHYSRTGSKKRRRGFFRRARPVSPTKYDLPYPSYPLLYGSGGYQARQQIPAYAPPLPQMPLYQPMPYTGAGPSYMQPSHMMMYSPQVSPPPMASPYVSRPPPPSMAMPAQYMGQAQPMYNNMAPPVSMPMGMGGVSGQYPPSYPSSPMRLVTDWTGGGQISPGFLGPPI